MAEILILGAGGFGTALAIMCAQNGHDVTLYSPFQEEIETLSAAREHKKLLPGVKIPETVKMVWELPQTVSAPLAVVATPSFAVRGVCASIKGRIGRDTVVTCVSKGFETGTLKTLSQVICEELPENSVVILSGPSHAEEVARGVPTTVVAASRSRAAAEFVQDTLMNPTLRIYVNDDVTGVELGGALKNVIALAAGIADGLGYGDNTKAALITRGIAEIARLGVKMGGKIESFTGLTGIGDLIVTCASVHSRNRKAGYLIGQGRTMQQAMDEVQMVVEGVYSTKAAVKLAQKYEVQMPIIEQVNAVLFEGKSAAEAVKELMLRDGKTEHSDLPWEA